MLTELAHANDTPLLVDGAQSLAHAVIDVQDLDCDFFTFSGHKVFAPTGIGVLYGKEKFLADMPPYHGGGDMILSVTFDKTLYNDLPYKFEAGTPNISGTLALEAALNYLKSVGMEAIRSYEKELLSYAEKTLKSLPDLRLIGTAPGKEAVVSFVVDGIHPHDLGTILDNGGVAVRTGHHCTQPLMDFFQVPATTRASFAFYNTKEEIDQLYNELLKAIKVFK